MFLGAKTATSEVAEDTKVKSTDIEVGEERYLSERVREEERNVKHAIRPLEGQETSMPTEEPYRATDDDGRITPSRGEYLEEADGDVMDSVFRLGRKSLVLFLWHIPEDVRLGGGGCREDFRPQAETRGRRANQRGAADAHKWGVGRLTWEEAPRCKVLPPWSIKGREGHM